MSSSERRAADSLRRGQRLSGNYKYTCVHVYIKEYLKVLFCYRENSFLTIYFNSESNAHYCLILLKNTSQMNIILNSFTYIKNFQPPLNFIMFLYHFKLLFFAKLFQTFKNAIKHSNLFFYVNLMEKNQRY